MRHHAGLALLCVLLSCADARADAIEGPPACPPGTTGRSAHEGQWCIAAPCATDAECRDGARCRAWRVCTQTSMVTPGGLRPEPAPPAPQVIAVASCDPARACTGTEEPPAPTVGELQGAPACSDGTFCVPPDLPALPARGAATAPAPAPGSASAATPASGSPPAPASGGSCACGTAGRRSATGAVALTAMAVALIARRRR